MMMTHHLDPWRAGWRAAAASIPLAGLQALELALEHDDEALMQTGTCYPPPTERWHGEPIEQADAIVLAGWRGLGLQTVGQAAQWFDDLRLAAGRELTAFLAWYDKIPRDEMRRALLPEVKRLLAVRNQP
jgi:hypothetical protein